MEQLIEKNYNIKATVTTDSRTYKGRTIPWTTYTIGGKDFARLTKPIIDLFKLSNKGLNWANDDGKVSLFPYPAKLVIHLWDTKYIPDLAALIGRERVIPDVAPDSVPAAFGEAKTPWVDSRSFAGKERVITLKDITDLSKCPDFRFKRSGFAEYSFSWMDGPDFNGGSIILEGQGGKADPKVYVNMYTPALVKKWTTKVDKALKIYHDLVIPDVAPDSVPAAFGEARKPSWDGDKLILDALQARYLGGRSDFHWKVSWGPDGTSYVSSDKNFTLHVQVNPPYMQINNPIPQAVDRLKGIVNFALADMTPPDSVPAAFGEATAKVKVKIPAGWQMYRSSKGIYRKLVTRAEAEKVVKELGSMLRPNRYNDGKTDNWRGEPNDILIEIGHIDNNPKAGNIEMTIPKYTPESTNTLFARIEKAINTAPDSVPAAFGESLKWDGNRTKAIPQDSIALDTQDPRTAKFIKGLISLYNMDKAKQGGGFIYFPMGGFNDKDIEARPPTKPLISIHQLAKNGLSFTRYVVMVYSHDTQTKQRIEKEYDRLFTKPDSVPAAFGESSSELNWKTHKIDNVMFYHTNLIAAQAISVIKKLGLEKSKKANDQYDKGVQKSGAKGYICLTDNTARTTGVWTVVVTDLGMKQAVEQSINPDSVPASFGEAAVGWRFNKAYQGYYKTLTVEQRKHLLTIKDFWWRQSVDNGQTVYRSLDGLFKVFIDLNVVAIMTDDNNIFKDNKVDVDFYLRQVKNKTTAPDSVPAAFGESRLSRILERKNPNAQFLFPQDFSEAFCQTILLSEDIVTKSSEFVKDSDIFGVKVFKEVWSTGLSNYPEGCDDASLTVYRNEAGDMVCTEDESGLIKILTKHGISPVKAKSGHCVCSIGFSEKEQKWYGWSHRAMVGFGIGDKIFEEGFGDENTLFTEHGSVTIENMAQARQAAEAFANYVS